MNGKVIRLAQDTVDRIEREMKPRETYDVTIRRLAGMPYRKPYRGKEEAWDPKRQ